MTILDEREATVSLKLIVAAVSIFTAVAFGGLWWLNAGHSSTAKAVPAQVDTGNI